MIKLFATDLDGTMLNALHEVDETIRRAVREVTDAGARLAIATGRPMGLSNMNGFEGLPVDMLGSNGSIVRDRSGELLKTFPIDPAELEALLQAFPEVCFDCVTADAVLVRGSRAQREASYNRGMNRRDLLFKIARWLHGTPVREDLVFDQTNTDVLAHEVCKLNCHVNDPGMNRELEAYLEERKDVLVNAPFQPVMFEISQRGVNKGTGVAWLANHYGIAEDEVAVYGDGGNDIEMLKRFRHAYAPRGASEEAKRAAGNVIGSCVLHAVPRHMVATVRQERNRVTVA